MFIGNGRDPFVKISMWKRKRRTTPWVGRKRLVQHVAAGVTAADLGKPPPSGHAVYTNANCFRSVVCGCKAASGRL